ncbi:CDP-alcohol phosphatidyltransferase family protein [Terrabacter aerolatus]|uniref:Membrane protein n=1 Tax=Terrabacter aerolatus TaxID=422442 RepID=A0A512D4X1_9MICO|nr:CDP-alcohol phosphatidyltransferase family protein [Terrabacter aerolatus]GEO31506.1 membrane protein [Terrabacter aerolatus]
MSQVIPPGPSAGLVGVVVLLGALEQAAPGRLGPAGWVVGLVSAVTVVGLLTCGLIRLRRDRLTPADRVTLTRAVIACAVAGLVAGALGTPGGGAPSGTLVVLASVALALDAVDGRVARRTGTVHPLGARFDMETDAFLILVLSIHVAVGLGWWVLGVGAARYVLLLVGGLSSRAPWLRGQVPPRRWRKAVAAYQGIALTAASSQIPSLRVGAALVAAGLVLLVVSFGTEVMALRRSARSAAGAAPVTVPWSRRPAPPVDAGVAP